MVSGKNALKVALGILIDQGLKLAIPYVRVLSNPAVKWLLRLIVRKLLDKHLDDVDEAKEAIDSAKSKGERKVLKDPKVKAKLAKVVHLNRMKL